MTQQQFRIALTADFYDADGGLNYADVGLDRLTAIEQIVVGRLEEHRPEIAPEQLAGVQGVLVLTPRSGL